MDELTVTLLSRTQAGRLDEARASRRQVILFERPDRYAFTTATEAEAIAEIELRLPQGADVLLHGLVLRDDEGRDLFRWAGAGDLFRQMQGLRLSPQAGAVRLEAIAPVAALTLTLDPNVSGRTVEVLLTLSSGRRRAEPTDTDRAGAAIEQLHARLLESEAAAAEREAAAIQRADAAIERQAADAAQREAEAERRHAALFAEIGQSRQALIAHVDRRHADAHAELGRALEALRDETLVQHRGLVDLINGHFAVQLQHEQARAVQAESRAAQLRELADVQAARIGALERSTSWRLTAPLRAIIHLLTGRMSLGAFAHRVRHYGDRPKPAPQPNEPAPPPAEPRQERPEPRPIAFPLPGAVAVLGELSPAPAKALPLTVSVVIPTYNAGHEFYWLLRKLKAQHGLARVEIVVVDSGSKDGTDTLAEDFGCKVVRIPNSEFSHSHARNLGADNASGELLLFTVQDAYPVGDWWLHSLALALTEPADDGVTAAAVSCSEFPRVDSELLYNAGVDTHYRFLGCRDADRFGRYEGDDGHMSLRVQGQLSDVACMIPQATFQKYRYQGRYAEDLILGVRLIKDGLKTAMLSSVKVIHSHNRPAAYHLKRTFVDVVFLTEVFPDFPVPRAESAAGAAAAAAILEQVVADWTPIVGGEAGEELRAFARRCRATPVDTAPAAPADFGFAPLGPWLTDALARDEGPRHTDAEQLRTMFADRLHHLAEFVGRTYETVDEHLAGELVVAARKTLAATLGAQLSFLYLRQAKKGDKARRAQAEDLRTLMTAGI